MAVLVHAVASLAITLVGVRLQDRLHSDVLEWAWGHVGLPLLRAASLVLFLLIAYPLLFGIPEPAPIGELLAGSAQRANQLLNLVFIVGLLLPLLGLRPYLVLPVQGVLAAALLFGWLAAHNGLVDFSYWPGAGAAVLVVLLSSLAAWLARHTVHGLDEWLERSLNIAQSRHLVGESLLLWLQFPALLAYTRALGEQLI